MPQKLKLAADNFHLDRARTLLVPARQESTPHTSHTPALLIETSALVPMRQADCPLPLLSAGGGPACEESVE